MVRDNSGNQKISIIDGIIKDQKKKNSKISLPKKGDKFGFVFSTKERLNFTLQSLAGLDQEKGFDLVWVDGSDTKEARELPLKYQFKNANLAEFHLDIKGGPNNVIQFGLKRLLGLGYDWCGLIENDIVLKPGWFEKLIELFYLAAEDNLAVGAATVRNWESRVLEYRSKYTINWVIGAGMVLFSRKAAELVSVNYPKVSITARKVHRSYAELFGVSLKGWDLWANHIDRRLAADWEYDIILYNQGMASVGSIPAFTTEIDPKSDPESRKTNFVGTDKKDIGLVHPFITNWSLRWTRLTDPFISLAWALLMRIPGLYNFVKFFVKLWNS